MPLKPGDVLLDRYTVETMLGAGGMGAVYRAHDNLHGTRCALKELRLDYLPSQDDLTRVSPPSSSAAPDPGNPLSGTREAALLLFRREAQLLARLDHPNLPKVTDYFKANDNYYLVMTLVEGRTPAEMMGPESDRPLPERQVLEWTEQVLDALEYCHKNGVVHRDVKPANIIVSADNRTYLVDFGIARPEQATRGQSRNIQVISPGFSPPEQYGSGASDPRSDIYSVGATLYQLLTGRVPLEAPLRGAGEMLQSPRSLVRSISAEVDAAITRALELQMDRRFHNVEQFRQALRGSTSKRPPPALKVIGTIAILAVVVTAGARLLPRTILTDIFQMPSGPATAVLSQSTTPILVVVAGSTLVGPSRTPETPQNTRQPAEPPRSKTNSASAQVTRPAAAVAGRPTANLPAGTAMRPQPSAAPTIATVLTGGPTVAPITTPYARVNGEAVNLRRGPGTDCAVVGRATRGQSLPVLARDPGGRWLLVRAPGGEAWVSSSVVTVYGAESASVKEGPVCPTRAPAPTIPPAATRPPAAPAGAGGGPTWCPHPDSCISDPRNNETISGITVVRGKANSANFQRYKVEYQPEGATTWGVLRERTQPVIERDGVLMEWYTWTVPPGAYLLRLTVVDVTGNYLPQALLRVVVSR